LLAWGRVELFTAQLLGASLALAPTLDEKMVLGEESLRHLQHFEVLSILYGEAGGRHLTKDASRGLVAEPLPQGWFAVGVAQWVLLVAARALSDACEQAHEGVGNETPRALEGIAADLREQFALADVMLRDLLQRQAPAQISFENEAEHWIRSVLELMAGQSHGLATAEAERAFLFTITTAFPSPDVRARFSERT
jgi:hypothetical protein